MHVAGTHTVASTQLSILPRRFPSPARTSHKLCMYNGVRSWWLSINTIRNLTVLIGFVTAFPMSLALMFSMKDMDSIINSKLPSAELFYQITGSKIVVTIIMVWIILIYFRMRLDQFGPAMTSLTVMIVACTSQWVTSGRMAWAFARDVRSDSSHKLCALLLTFFCSKVSRTPNTSRTSVHPSTFPSERPSYL